MDYEYEASNLTAAEKANLHARLDSGEKISLTAAERHYLINETIRAKQETKDLLLAKLMVVNTYSKAKRVEETIEVNAGRVSTSVLVLLDALDAAIEATGVFITTIDEGPTGFPSTAVVHQYATSQAHAALDLNEFQGFQIVAGFFEAEADT